MTRDRDAIPADLREFQHRCVSGLVPLGNRLRIHADNLNWALNEGNEVDLRLMAQSTAEGLLETVDLLKQWRDRLMK